MNVWAVEEHGHSQVTYTMILNKPRFKGLKDWVGDQRQEYRTMRSGLPSLPTEDRIKSLEELDFCWDVPQQEWESRFLELKEYKNQHGDTIVPRKEGSLGRWVSSQRSYYRKNALSKEHIEKLDSIGFVWDPREWRFQQRLEELRAKEHGHVRVPSSDGALGGWFYRQRAENLNWLEGKPTPLSEAHRLALEDVGFGPHLAGRREDDVQETPSQLSWEERFEQLLDYREQNGHVRVPCKDGSLGTWVNTQRMNTLSMSKERRKKLDEIGFVWNMDDWRWDLQFEALNEFRDHHGHTNVPQSHGKLGEWVMNQRAQYSLFKRGDKSHLTEDRVDRLLRLQFCFDRGSLVKTENDKRWYEKLQELKQWKDKHGNYNVRQTQGALGDWVQHQRNYYRNGLRGNTSVMTPEREAELNAIGFGNDMDLT